MMKFSIPIHATARKNYGAIRLLQEEYLLANPVMVDVNFGLVARVMINPEVENLYESIPRKNMVLPSN